MILALVPGLPPWAEWAGLIATVVGTLFAFLAAMRAKGARVQANLAKEAAIRLGRIAQIIDMVGDLQELQTMLARQSFGAVADKCARLRGRVVRFKEEAYNDLSVKEAENLDSAGMQLEIIARVAAEGKDVARKRTESIQRAYRQLEVALNSVSGVRKRETRGE